MMRRRLFPPLLAILALWPTCRTQAATSANVKSVLAGAPALQTPVTLSETKVPVGELLQSVSSATGVPLRATGPAADEPVAVVVTAMPAARLLDELALFLDYRWGRDVVTSRTAGGGSDAKGSAGFRLYQGPEQREHERALYLKARQNEWDRLKIVASSYAEVGRLSDREYAAARQAMEHPASNLPPLSPAADRLQRALRDCGSSARRAMARLLAELTGNDWKTLASGRLLRYYSHPDAGEKAMPLAVVQRLASFRPSTTPERQQFANGEGGLMRPGDTLESRRETIARQDEAWAHAPSFQVVIRPERWPRGHVRGDAPELLIEAAPLSESGKVADPRHEQMSVWIYPITTQPGWGDDPPPRRAELDQDPVFSRRKAFRGSAPPPRREDGDIYFGRVTNLLPEIARTFDISLLADAYDGAPPLEREQLEGQRAETEPTMLRAVLTRFAGNYYRWDRHDNLALLRSRSWFYERPREIPLRTTRRWDELIRLFGALPRREYFAAVWSLSDDQLDNLRLGNGFPARYRDLRLDPNDVDAFRLLKTLSLAQQRRLEQGDGIPFEELSAVQRDGFFAVLDGEDVFRPSRITRGDLATAGVRLSAEPMLLFRRDYTGGAVAYYSISPSYEPKDLNELPWFAPPPGDKQSPKTKRFEVLNLGMLLRCGAEETWIPYRIVAR